MIAAALLLLAAFVADGMFGYEYALAWDYDSRTGMLSEADFANIVKAADLSGIDYKLETATDVETNTKFNVILVREAEARSSSEQLCDVIEAEFPTADYSGYMMIL